MTMRAASSTWLLRKPIPSPSMRLFCFPYAGGGASTYRPWQDGLPAGIEVCGVQLPGRESRFGETPATTLAELLPALADALREWLDRPFAFFGHSMGALIAFELARRLQTSGGPMPAILFASAYPAPHLPNDSSRLVRLPDQELIEELRAMGGMPQELLDKRELLELVLPVIRADLWICESHAYRRGPKLALPIEVFGGLDDRAVTHGELTPWSVHTESQFRIRMLPGNHFFVHTARPLLLRHVAEALAHSTTREAHE
jgi:medium-chain acyl-[acyl-carrier-protein] hydrolase